MKCIVNKGEYDGGYSARLFTYLLSYTYLMVGGRHAGGSAVVGDGGGVSSRDRVTMGRTTA